MKTTWAVLSKAFDLHGPRKRKMVDLLGKAQNKSKRVEKIGRHMLSREENTLGLPYACTVERNNGEHWRNSSEGRRY